MSRRAENPIEKCFAIWQAFDEHERAVFDGMTRGWHRRGNGTEAAPAKRGRPAGSKSRGAMPEVTGPFRARTDASAAVPRNAALEMETKQ